MSKKILIVEDEKNIVDILNFNLTKEGYDTMEAYDGQTGLQLALEQDPDPAGFGAGSRSGSIGSDAPPDDRF